MVAIDPRTMALLRQQRLSERAAAGTAAGPMPSQRGPQRITHRVTQRQLDEKLLEREKSEPSTLSLDERKRLSDLRRQNQQRWLSCLQACLPQQELQACLPQQKPASPYYARPGSNMHFTPVKSAPAKSAMRKGGADDASRMKSTGDPYPVLAIYLSGLGNEDVVDAAPLSTKVEKKVSFQGAILEEEGEEEDGVGEGAK